MFPVCASDPAEEFEIRQQEGGETGDERQRKETGDGGDGYGMAVVCQKRCRGAAPPLSLREKDSPGYLRPKEMGGAASGLCRPVQDQRAAASRVP